MAWEGKHSGTDDEEGGGSGAAPTGFWIVLLRYITQQGLWACRARDLGSACISKIRAV